MPAANTLRLDDGFPTFISMANLPTVHLYMKTVTPPSISAGGPIETTTMHNTAWRTNEPKKLKQIGQVSASCAYATDAIPAIQAQIGVKQILTVHFPDGATLAYWGWIDAFTPAQVQEGQQPTANVVFEPSLRDSDGNETAPVYTAPTESSGA